MKFIRRFNRFMLTLLSAFIFVMMLPKTKEMDFKSFGVNVLLIIFFGIGFDTLVKLLIEKYDLEDIISMKIFDADEYEQEHFKK